MSGNYEQMNAHIDKIESALEELSRNPKGGWTDLMKAQGVPYYGTITGALRKRGIAVPEGTGLRWVGDKPTRTLAALIYEESKEASTKSRSRFKNKNKVSNGAQPKASPATEQPKEVAIRPANSNGTQQVSDATLIKALAIMEKAMRHQVPDPVAFTLDVLKDERI